MTALADPTIYGKEPGRGPLRAGGQPGTTVLTEANRPSTRSRAVQRQALGLGIVRDLEAGAERVRERAGTYLPQNPAEDGENYAVRLERSVFHNFFRRTAEGLTGLVFRVDPWMNEDVPAKIVEHWEAIDGAGQHGDVFCRAAFFDAFIAGHAAIFVEYPKVEGKQSLAQERTRRPYWLLIHKDNIVSWRTAIQEGEEVLTQLVLEERTMVPLGEFGEQEQIRYRIFRQDAGVVVFALVEENSAGKLDLVDTGDYPTQTRIPIAEIATSGRVGLFESIPPLLDLAYLNIAHYQQWSDYATSIHKTCVPILFGAGVSQPTNQAGQGVVVGANSSIWSSDPAATLAYTSHNGEALDACKRALDELKSDIGVLGLSMLTPQKRMAETAEAKRIDKATGDSSLAVAARGLQDAVEMALQFHANYLGIPEGGQVEINRDFEGVAMESSVMIAYGQLVRDAGFPARMVLEMLQRGGRLPPNVDLDELELEMAAEMAAQATINAAVTPKAGEPEDEESDTE